VGCEFHGAGRFQLASNWNDRYREQFYYFQAGVALLRRHGKLAEMTDFRERAKGIVIEIFDDVDAPDRDPAAVQEIVLNLKEVREEALEEAHKLCLEIGSRGACRMIRTLIERKE
jgi:hypothetical protein